MEDETQKEQETPEEDPIDKSIRLTKELKTENDRREAVVEAEQKLLSQKILAGDGGGNVPIKVLSEEDKKKEAASNFFKNTALGDAIDKS